MRLILSTFLAAALVFCGTLFMAGYFDGLEIRSDGPPQPMGASDPGKISSHEPSVDRKSLWHCPEVERILAAPLPEIFSPLSRDGRKIDARFKWHDVEIRRLWGEADGRVYGNILNCNYHVERSLLAPGERRSWHLFLSPQFAAEVNIGSSGDGPWNVQILSHGTAADCDISTTACGFHLVSPNGAVPSNGYPIHPPEVPVEQGGSMPVH